MSRISYASSLSRAGLLSGAGLLGLGVMLVACGGDDATPPKGDQGGAAGLAGNAGSGNAGSAGSANGGTAGSGNGGSGNAGSGNAGSGGSAGSANGGSAGAGGSAGGANGGSAGSAGSSGSGGSGGCPTGYADCDPGVPGCETATGGDLEHCGACNSPCGTEHVETRSCTLGLCALICVVGYFDCNGDPSDGCEVDLMGDPDHCGSCTNVCGSDGVASRACNGGLCAPTCSSGRASCNATGNDGCEVTLATNSAHCGSCAHACAATNASAVSCSAGVCRPTCNSTHGDCSSPPSGSPDNGCETDLRTASNCGECGHSCLGGACNVGQSCDPLTLATGLNQVGGMTVDATHVYYTISPQTTTGGSVGKVSINGGSQTTLIADTQYPRGIQVSGSYVYVAGGFLDTSYIKRVGTTGSGLTTLYNAPVNRGAQYIQLSGSNLYWVDPRNQNAYRMAITGGTVTKMNSSGTANISEDVATDGSYFYTTDYAKIVSRMPLAGGAMSNLVPIGSSQYQRIAVDTTHVYYLDDSEVWRVAKAGGSAERVVTHANAVSSLALDGGHVYYIAANGVFRAAKGTASTEVTLWLGTTTSVDAEIYGGALYWVGTAAMKLAL